jgi:hypothetical protein
VQCKPKQIAILLCATDFASVQGKQPTSNIVVKGHVLDKISRKAAVQFFAA